MRRTWLIHEKHGSVILFFSGWGMDEQAVRHVAGDEDVLMFYDYRDISNEKASDMSGYEKVYLVAWSMGVWVASVLVPRWGVQIDRAVAINGTGRPVDDLYGIPTRMYTLTENGMNERGREKFFARMLDGKEEIERFAENKPCRFLEEQVEELKSIRVQAKKEDGGMRWDLAYISEKDRIFPVANQRNWWEKRTTIHYLPGGHYPFYVFDNWNRIIG